MTIRLRQDSLDQVAASVTTPAYDRKALTPGILHFGVGNFHRAHQAVYLDKLFSLGRDTDWAIIGAGVRREDEIRRRQLEAQDWLSSVTEVEAGGCATRVCGSMIDFVPIDTHSRLTIDALNNPDIRIVSLTITEGGYFLQEGAGGFNAGHPEVIHDVKNSANLKTVFGILVAGLIERRRAGLSPFTVMSCDNLPGNGRVARQAVVGMARLMAPDSAEWIDENVAFPNSMVDCITPATGARERALARDQLGVEDAAPVVCESFRQWIVEDRFPQGRPALEQVGAEFVADVEPYELMKLRIINGGHACIAYPSALLGIKHVHSAMQDPLIRQFLQKIQTDEMIPTVKPIPGVNAKDYFELTKQRFGNPQIADEIARLCMSGSDRQPKFIFPAIIERLNKAQPVDGLALEVALWCRYCAGTDEAGKPLIIDDINAERLRKNALNAKTNPDAFLQMTDLFGALSDNRIFRNRFAAMLNSLWKHGTPKTLQNYTG